MPSKSQAHRDKKSVSTQRPSRPATPNLDPLAREAHLARIVQRAKLDPGSLTSPDVLELQRTVGNRAIVQRLPDYYVHKSKKDGREVKVSEEGKELRVDVVKGGKDQWAKLEYHVRKKRYVLHEIESHPPEANLGAILVYYLAKKASAINQESMAVDLPAASARGFYKGMGFKLVESDLKKVAASKKEFQEVLAIAKIRDKFPIELAIRNAKTLEELFKLTPPNMISSLQALLQVAMNKKTAKAIPGLQGLKELERLKYLLQLKRFEIAIPMRGTTQDILNKSKASMDKRWKKKC